VFYQAIAVLLFLQGANPVAAMLQRAKEYFESGAYSEARAELQQALKLAPRDATLWSYLGLTDYKLHDSEASIADFEQASAVNPHDSLNYFNLGMLHQQRGERAKALEDYRQGLALAPDDADANQSYARLLMEARRYREAIGPLERLQRNSPSNPSFRLGLAECYLRVGSNDQLDEEIQEIVKAPNSTTNDRLNLAKLLVENKQPDAARWVLEQVVQTAPGVADAHAGLGIALMDLGQNRNAATELARAVQLSPNSADYAMRYAEALLLSKQYSGAFDFLNSVKDKFGKLPEYRFKHGLACYGMSEYRCAIEELEGLLGDYPDLDRAEYYLGHSYSATGDLAKAEAHYRKAIALNPQEAIAAKRPTRLSAICRRRCRWTPPTP